MGKKELMVRTTAKTRSTADPDVMVAKLLVMLPQSLRGTFRRWLRQIIRLHIRRYRNEIKLYINRRVKALDRKYSEKLAALKQQIREQDEQIDREKSKLEWLRQEVRRENEEFLDELYQLFRKQRPHKDSQVVKRSVRREEIH